MLKESTLTMLFVEHDKSFAEAVADYEIIV
jgi:ABC-type polar amino acid transport system ATPase subunit